MKNFFKKVNKSFTLWVGFGLITLNVNAATVIATYSLNANVTNTFFTNQAVITGLSLISTAASPTAVKFYDTVGGGSTWGYLTHSNAIVSRVQVTEYFTNGIFSFLAPEGHATNYILRSTNVTYVLSTTYSNTIGATGEYPRLANLVLASTTGSPVVTTFDGLNIAVTKGLTIASGTNGVTVTVIYAR